MIGLTAVAALMLASMQQAESLRAPGALVERVATGFVHTEGPASDAAGNVFFSDNWAGRVHRWSDASRSLTLVRSESGGANGLAFDSDGMLVAAEGDSRQITRMTMDGEVTVIVRDIDGQRFNRPNDLWIDARGGIYFSDPAYSTPDEERDLAHESVYYVPPGSGARARQVTGHLNAPNGVVGSIDGDILYVTEHLGGTTWAFDIEPDGSLSRQRLFAAVGVDGMTVDREGNVYLANLGAGSVDVYSSDGELLESIAIPERPTNVTFGGADRRTLFITAGTSLYSLRMLVQG